MADNPPINRFMLLALWIGTSVVAWAVAPIDNFDREIKTYAAIALQMAGFLLCGLLMGAVASIGQSLALKRHLGIDARGWMWATFLGHALFLPVGLALHTVMMFPVWGVNFLPLSEPSTWFFITLPQSVIFGGMALGLTQWQALKHFAPRRDWVMAALWIFGTWASLTIGWVLGSILNQALSQSPATTISFGPQHRILIGLSAGMLNGLLLLLTLHPAIRIQSQRQRGGGSLQSTHRRPSG